MQLAFKDSITLHPISINMVIGVLPHERLAPQSLIVSVTLFFDMGDAIREDSVESTVDYAAVLDQVVAFSCSDEPQLLEAFAGRLADHLLSVFLRLDAVAICVEKPEVFHSLPLVTLKLTRMRA